MGKWILLAGLLCIVVAVILFVVYLVVCQSSGKTLKRQLMEEY